jgi:hypothetical protein
VPDAGGASPVACRHQAVRAAASVSNAVRRASRSRSFSTPPVPADSPGKKKVFSSG